MEELRFESVGPAVGAEVTRAAAIAVGVAALFILVFIIFAFRKVPNAFRYGVCAIAAMIHDILVTVGLFSIAGLVLGWEADALFLTAILTVIGFSVQDTIVVFDRIRENIPKRRGTNPMRRSSTAACWRRSTARWPRSSTPSLCWSPSCSLAGRP